MQINTHTEWDPLEEVIIGRATGAQVPTVKDESLHAVNYGDKTSEECAAAPCGKFPDHVIEESDEDLDAFAAQLEQLGVKVHRPAIVDFTEKFRTAHWEVDGYYGYCPRDTVLTIGNQAIETPMVLRHRQNEAERLFGHVFHEQMFRAPRPKLLDSLYDRSVIGRPTLRNDEPAFDAANCLKLGYDVLYLISNTGNQAGADWLQAHLGSPYRVHPVRDVYAFIHIDSTMTLLKPGLVLLCPARVKEDQIPECIRNWDRIWCPDPVEVPSLQEWGGASKWIAMNILSIRPDLAAVEANQVPLMRELEKHGVECVPVQLRHTRTLGGGPHCVSLDLRRQGELADYAK